MIKALVLRERERGEGGWIMALFFEEMGNLILLNIEELENLLQKAEEISYKRNRNYMVLCLGKMYSLIW